MKDTIFLYTTEKIASMPRIVHATTRSVAHIHEKEVVHEDLKPSKWLWIDRRSLPSLCDFETATERRALTRA